MKLWLKRLISFLLYLALVIGTIYFFGAVYFDGPFDVESGLGAAGNLTLAILWLGLLAYLFWMKLPSKVKYGLLISAYAVVIVPWMMISPSNERNWQAEFSKTGWMEKNGDILTFHQCRDFIHTENKVTERWITRTHDLNKLQGVDLFFDAFGGENLAHTILSFDFGNEGRICLSIETRREKSESFSSLGGLYKMFELQYIFGTEEDLVMVRTNIRREPVFLYRFNYSPEESRQLLMESVEAANDLYRNPRFYNVIWANCTTSYRAQTPANEREVFDWRILVNGHFDTFLYDKGMLVTDGLSFKDYNDQAKINEVAEEVDDRNKFSEKVRENRVGFDEISQ